MIPSAWLLRYAARLDVIALRLAYSGHPREDRAWASYAVPDSDGMFRLHPLYVGRVPWFIELEYEHGRIYSAAEVQANRSCGCRRVEMAVD